jgi:hypothetical protein
VHFGYSLVNLYIENILFNLEIFYRDYEKNDKIVEFHKF